MLVVLYRHGIECVITKVKCIVELKGRVLAPWGLSSISAVVELVEPSPDQKIAQLAKIKSPKQLYSSKL